ncbi:MAG TPA: DUF2950 domain-containing protein [Verrucomicrobiota bacterium]|nr:DUF2950 domain-containing protein [Verrucomicrobiota bacterium]
MKLTLIRRLLACLLVVTSVGLTTVSAAGQPRTFASPQDAVTALREAVAANNLTAFEDIFGPEGSYLVNPDPVMAAGDFERFSKLLAEGYRLSPTAANQQVLEVGASDWPFPVPLVQQGGGWQFDAEAGREEILDRRIGANELSVLLTLRAFVAAQKEYAAVDRNGDDVLEYARKFISSPGKKDGLYWPADLDGTESPMGPQVAAAQAEGYSKLGNTEAGPQPFHGYYFKILTRQGKHTPAGAYDYIINGHMIGGFAAIAWPAEYGETGVMTFIVNQQGRVYQRDLGPKTAKLVKAIKEYDPGEGWKLSED